MQRLAANQPHTNPLPKLSPLIFFPFLSLREGGSNALYRCQTDFIESVSLLGIDDHSLKLQTEPTPIRFSGFESGAEFGNGLADEGRYVIRARNRIV